MESRGYLSNPLARIKFLHTAIWAAMAGCIMALPAAAIARHFDAAIALTGIILAECFALAINRGQCPLTGVAARFTTDRADNFDIYLPRWLARHNKLIFGTVFVINELFLLWQWVRSHSS